mmetsp:Transcript_18869/g.72720  ORF Transcript_18869/g.72720 Transcript_18869/m.72720 type:complete len:207 (+) Transcript_18869:1787-2407(+)
MCATGAAIRRCTGCCSSAARSVSALCSRAAPPLSVLCPTPTALRSRTSPQPSTRRRPWACSSPRVWRRPRALWTAPLPCTWPPPPLRCVRFHSSSASVSDSPVPSTTRGRLRSTTPCARILPPPFAPSLPPALPSISRAPRVSPQPTSRAPPTTLPPWRPFSRPRRPALSNWTSRTRRVPLRSSLRCLRAPLAPPDSSSPTLPPRT